ncbi:MAG: SH3 domain-containing protein [Anaerolineales bacterium]|nr:SH3 domain-containing protein [Anaerolineales bacterium]
MIKKQLWLFLPILILIITGCAHEEAAHLEPIDPARWPTAAVEAAAPSPTPFPRATLRIEPTMEAAGLETPAPTSEPVEPTATPASSAAASGSGVNADLAAAVISNALSQFSIVATGVTIAPDLAIRQGPGANYGSVTSIEPGSVFGILGKNSGGDWVYVVDAALSPGWLPVSGLRVVGSLDGAPVLPANPIAALVQSAASAPSAASATSGETAPAASNEPVLAANLTPVTTAKVNNDGLNMRQGPGASYARIVTLANNAEVSVLALNPRKDWALVETANKQRGWVSLTFLSLAGSVATAPIIPAAELSQASVPVSESSAQPAAITVPAEPVSNPAPALGNLGPVATAKTVRDPVEVRPGPGTDYAPIDELRLSDEVIPLLAVDPTGQWVLVNPTSATLGWVVLNDLKVEGSLENAPKINTAWVESNAVEVRSGPGIFHDSVGVLAIRSIIQVSGLDESRSWVLVKPIPAGDAAWAPLNFLTPGGRWSDMPDAPELPPAAEVAAAAQPAAKPFTPTNAQPHLVFQRSSGGDIMVINPDGSGLRRLTSGIDPVLSPDGQRVAFTRWEGETGSIWVINLDGSGERQIQGFVKQAKGPDWSPDGSQLIFNFQDGGRLDSKTECFPVGEGKNPPRPPRNATDFKVSFGSGGAQVCWKLPPDPHWGLRVVNLTDDKFKDVDGGTYAFRPAWDPGQPWRIVSDGGRGLLEVDVNRDYRQAITDEINDGSPVFSPDGRYLAVTLGQQGGGSNWNIFRLNANGTGRVQLTETPLWETAQPGNDKAWNNVAPAWSPNGSQIAFLTDRTGGWEIWVMNADGSDQRPLFSAEVNEQLQIKYDFVDERVLSWR